MIGQGQVRLFNVKVKFVASFPISSHIDHPIYISHPSLTNHSVVLVHKRNFDNFLQYPVIPKNYIICYLLQSL